MNTAVIEHIENTLPEDMRILVGGQLMTELPQDLYIPPNALAIFLEEMFEGPLDLLLYLIRKQNLDILNIPIAEITRQYMTYVEWMKKVQLELAGEYLLMAALLAEIKSRMLLPRHETALEEEADPRAELVRRLQEYERYKEAAERLDTLPRLGRDFFIAGTTKQAWEPRIVHPEVDLNEVLLALKEVMQRAQLFEQHHIGREPLSVREKMSELLDVINNCTGFILFTSLFKVEQGRRGVVVTFLAILELLKSGLIDFIQTEPFAPIHVKKVSLSEPEEVVEEYV